MKVYICFDNNIFYPISTFKELSIKLEEGLELTEVDDMFSHFYFDPKINRLIINEVEYCISKSFVDMTNSKIYTVLRQYI